MNCKELLGILDEQELQQLSVAERATAEAHVAGCPDCARYIELHRNLAQLPIPALTQERVAGWRAVALSSSITDRNRLSRSRPILIGTLLALAAAAALLGLWGGRPAALTVPTGSKKAVQPVVLQTVDRSRQAKVMVEPAVDLHPQAAASVPNFARVIVRVPEVQIKGNDLPGNAMAQRFRNLVIAKLSNVAGLAVAGPDFSGLADADVYEIRMEFAGASAPDTREIEVDAASVAQFAAETNMNPAARRRSVRDRQINGALMSSASHSSSTGVSFLLGSGFPRSETLQSPSPPPWISDEIGYFAAQLVRELRVKALPRDSALERELLATVGNSAQGTQRLIAITDLLNIADRHGGLQTVDDAVVRAGAEFAMTLAETREREMVWDGLALTRNAELIPYLIRGLDVAPQTEARLQMLRILSTQFKDNPQARSALEAASSHNSEAVVRMAALRESQDGSTWNEFVINTLNDTGLSDQRRLQPLADMAPGRAASAADKPRTIIQLDESTIRNIRAVIAGTATQSSDTAQTAQQAIEALGSIGSLAVRDLLLDIMRLPGDELTGLEGFHLMGVKMKTQSVLANRYPRDAKVRAAIEDVASGPESMRSIAARSLVLFTMKPADRASETEAQQQQQSK